MTDRIDRRRNGWVALVLVGVVAIMTGLSFAAVPLYREFCQATGFAGTTQVAKRAPGAIAQTIIVRFNADTAPDLPWSFEPTQRWVRVHPGEQTLITYRATNHSNHTITGTAAYNVTPQTAGAYFDKIQCFCFTKQTLGPGETAELPVTFFVAPQIMQDKNTRDIDAITLSYTFFQAKTSDQGGASDVSEAARPTAVP